MIIVISLSHKIEKLPSMVINWNDLNEEAKQTLLSCTDFRIMNSQAMLTYQGRQIITSCLIDIYEDGMIEIENCCTKEGELFSKYD